MHHQSVHRYRTIVLYQADSQTDNIVLYTITVRVDNDHEKSSCAPPNQYKATLCTTIVYVGTELHCEPWFACSLSTTKYYTMHLCPYAPRVYVRNQTTWKKWRGHNLPEKCLLYVLVPHQIRTKSVRFVHVPWEPPENEKFWGWPPLLTYIGPPCAPWCTKQVGGPQHSPVLLRECTT